MDALNILLEKVDFLPPGRVTDDTSVLTLKNLVFEPLCRWENGSARPGLFSSWTHSTDGRQWRFTLRPGAMFHDGKPCTAADILEFIDAILNAVDTFGMKWSYARYLAAARFSVAADDCLALDNPHPIADIVDIFSEFFICRVAPDGQAILGTGPYRVTSFTPKETVTLQRVAAAGSGPARIVAKAMPHADDRCRALLAGEADAALNLERMDGRIPFHAPLAWHKAVNTLSVIDYLNCAQGLFASPLARLAVNHAVDVQSIIDELFGGLGVRAATIVSPFHLGYQAAGISPIAFDRDKARALFEQVDVPGDIVIRTPEFMPERALEISQMIQASLDAVGIRSRLDVQKDRPEYAREVGRKHIGDMAIFDSSPHSTYRILNDKISSRVKAVWWQGFDDAKLEPLIESANHAVEPAAREAAYGRCLARLNANPPWLYLFHPIEVLGTKTGLNGLSLDHKGVLVVAN